MTLRSLPVCCCRSLLPKYDLSCHFQLPTSSNAAPASSSIISSSFSFSPLFLIPFVLLHFLRISLIPLVILHFLLFIFLYFPFLLFLPLLPLLHPLPLLPFHPFLHLLPLPSPIFTFFTYFPSSPTPCLSPKQALHGAASLPAAVAHLQPKYNLACHF